MSSSSPPDGAGEGRRLRIALLGSTGSIGRQAVDVIARDPSFEVVGLATGRNAALLGEQARQLRPEVVVLADPAGRADLGELPAGTRLESGSEPLEAPAAPPGPLAIPLPRDPAAARAEADPRDHLASPLGWLRPIDSEHSAIWQCLVGEAPGAIARLVLTASGGPFLDLDAAALAAVTPAAALKHPTWQMGSKITINSATLVNKGLEANEGAR